MRIRKVKMRLLLWFWVFGFCLFPSAVRSAGGGDQDQNGELPSSEPPQEGGPAEPAGVPIGSNSVAGANCNSTLVICSYWRNNCCAAGDLCCYRHVVFDEDFHLDVPCPYLPFGRCFYGDGCLYQHSQDVIDAAVARFVVSTVITAVCARQQQVCRFFLLGSCRFGDRCHYLHQRQNDIPDVIFTATGDAVADNVIADYHTRLGDHRSDVDRAAGGSGVGRHDLPSYDPDETVLLRLRSITASGGLCRLIRQEPPITTASFIEAWGMFMAATRVLAGLAGMLLTGAEEFGVNIGTFPPWPALFFHGTTALCALSIIASRAIAPNVAHRRGDEKGQLGARGGVNYGSAWSVADFKEAVRWAALTDLGCFYALIFGLSDVEYRPVGWFVQFIVVVQRDITDHTEGGWVSSRPLPVVGFKIHLVMGKDSIGKIIFPTIPGGFGPPDHSITAEVAAENLGESTSSSSGIPRDAEGRPLNDGHAP